MNIACIITQCLFVFLRLNIHFSFLTSYKLEGQDTALCQVCVWILLGSILTKSHRVNIKMPKTT